MSSAKEKTSPIPPPMAHSQEVSVYRGHHVTIVLQVSGRIVEPLSFLIRTPPKKGLLGEVRRTSRTTATVTYTSDPAGELGDDSFTFAVKSFDAPVSASARIRLKIAEEPPQLEAASEIDFGTVYLGGNAIRDLTLRNKGGGIAAGTIEVKSPWEILGPAHYRLAHNQACSLHLSFLPLEEREFREPLQLGQDAHSMVILRGKGVIPLSWAPREIAISPEQREQGELRLIFTNHTPEILPLKIHWPSFVKGSDEILLPPQADTVVKGNIPSDNPREFHDEILFESRGFRGKISLRIFPPPPQLKITPEHELNLGKPIAGHVLKGRFVVQNVGISAAPLRFTIPPEILIQPDPVDVILLPNEERAFDVQLDTSPYLGNIGIESPPSFQSKLTVVAPEALPERDSNKSSRAIENFLQIAPSQKANLQSYTGKVPPVASIKTVSTPHDIEIRWTITSPDASGYRIERRKLSVEGQRTVIEWVPWPEFRIHLQNGEAIAHLGRLPSNTFWIIRIVGLDAHNIPSTPSTNFRIETRPLERSTPYWLYYAVAMICALGLIKWWRSHRRKLSIEQNERIARLGKS